MNKKILLCVMIVIMLAIAGCTTKNPNINIEANWKGFTGWIPFIANDMGTKDKKTIEFIVENKDIMYLEGITLRINSNIPGFRVAPDQIAVMKLGPEGTSKTSPSSFTLETFDTPPGKYSFWISAEYNGRIIKSEKLDIDIG